VSEENKRKKLCYRRDSARCSN